MINVKGFVFDMDGTVYLGKRPIPDAIETLRQLRLLDKKILFLSNYPLETREAKVEKLTRMGIQVSEEEILTSSYVLTIHLSKLKKGARILPIAEEITIAGLLQSGHSVTNDPAQCDYVVISWDRGFTYEKLNLAYQAVMRGAKMIATNPDRTCPFEDGELPDAAGMIGAIEAVTGKKVDIMVGKPSRIMGEAATEALGLRPEECIVIGDRLETDILMGKSVGMQTALVLTGVTKRTQLDSRENMPDFVLDSIADLRCLVS